MKSTVRPLVILMAEDDDEDRLLMREGLHRSGLLHELHTVENGEELLDYLRKRGKYCAPEIAPAPGVILLDLNMPRMNGFEALREIRDDASLRHFPVVVLTTSHAQDDVLRSYAGGANSFISKPVTFEALVDMIRSMGNYWFGTVQLPVGEDA